MSFKDNLLTSFCFPCIVNLTEFFGFRYSDFEFLYEEGLAPPKPEPQLVKVNSKKEVRNHPSHEASDGEGGEYE